ncbi:MAG TPA: hypothetical protein DDZ68_16655 [Parvularcula sp.]|nr:hypothetical protein [Parvularcula sp.]HBS36704.1 hypothetical protein [Parvularcula sp.]
MGEGILRKFLLASAWAFVLTAPVHADETVTFTYDEYGRLVRAARAGAVNNGVATDYQYDKADNRTRRTLTGSSGTSPSPSFSVNDVSAAEGSTLVFTVTRSGTSTGSYSVNYATANGTAAAGSDYTSASGTVTFASGETSKTVSVTTLSDAVSEGNETVLLNLSSATGGATISDNQGVGTITNVSPPPSFSVSDAVGEEGDTMVFIVTRSGDTSGTNNVSYATANGTAVSPSDYSALSGTLTFTSGQTTKTLSTSLPYGTNGEPTEVMYLNLSSPTGGASISDSQGVGSIYNVPLCGGVPC